LISLGDECFFVPKHETEWYKIINKNKDEEDSMEYQLYAKIRKDSKSWTQKSIAQNQGELPFPIKEISPEKAPKPGFCMLGGPGDNYRPEDLHLYVIVTAMRFKYHNLDAVIPRRD
jgi:hypothetical protein